MSDHDESERIMARLAAPFPEVKRRTGTGNETWEYIDPSMAMNRLDDAVGPANWKDQYIVRGDSVECILTITLPGGREVHRSGASAYVWQERYKDPQTKQWAWRDIKPSMVVKTAYSEAFKVACVAFGIGRYLKNKGKLKHYMPEYFARHAAELGAATAAATQAARPPRDLGAPEAPGAAMIEKFMKFKNGHKFIEWLSGYGAEHQFPEWMKAWDEDQCKAAVAALNEAIAAQQRAGAAS